ncbi:hypothetical protein A5692_08850 [Mycobacterium sp. E342]|nr:hypothetical protein A5692_08850 [Mycobacterium sp. E342]
MVDDEANIVELLSVSLKFQGFEVYTATNGAQALDRAREARPDAVILDVMMPGMDGFGVLRRLRENHTGIGWCVVYGALATFGGSTYSRRETRRDERQREYGWDHECQTVSHAEHPISPCREIVVPAALLEKGRSVPGSPRLRG